MSEAWPLRALAIREQLDTAMVLDLLDIRVLPSGQLSCPNPAHADSHPSARYYPGALGHDGKVHCFTCGQTWDAIGLVGLVHGLSFPDAITWLETHCDLVEATDAAMVASVLRRVGQSDCSALVALVETTIHGARARCTLPQYARLWRAFDTAKAHFGDRKIDEPTFVAVLDRVLALVPPMDLEH